MTDTIVLPTIDIWPNRGGTADVWDPHGSADQSPYSGLVIQSIRSDQVSIIDDNRQVPTDQASYYSGYWAGVQGSIYSFGPPGAPPIHSFGFQADILGLTHPGIPTNNRSAPGNISEALHSNLMWLTPEDTSSWAGSSDWPADLPDWGPAPGGSNLPMPNFFPAAQTQGNSPYGMLTQSSSPYGLLGLPLVPQSQTPFQGGSIATPPSTLAPIGSFGFPDVAFGAAEAALVFTTLLLSP